MLKISPRAQKTEIADAALLRQILILVLITEMKLQLADVPVHVRSRDEQLLVEAEAVLNLVADFTGPGQNAKRTPFVMQQEIIERAVLVRCGRFAVRGG